MYLRADPGSADLSQATCVGTNAIASIALAGGECRAGTVDRAEGDEGAAAVASFLSAVC